MSRHRHVYQEANACQQALRAAPPPRNPRQAGGLARRQRSFAVTRLEYAVHRRIQPAASNACQPVPRVAAAERCALPGTHAADPGASRPATCVVEAWRPRAKRSAAVRGRLAATCPVVLHTPAWPVVKCAVVASAWCAAPTPHVVHAQHVAARGTRALVGRRACRLVGG